MKIQSDIKSEVEKKISAFNRQNKCKYIARYKGKFLYLDRASGFFGSLSPVFRLTFSGDIESWDFAIYKFSRESYDSEGFFFPGSEHVDGTIEGAMLAGLEAYT